MLLTSTSILCLNAFVYTLTLGLFYIRTRSLNPGMIMLLMYASSAWAALLFFRHEYFIFTLHYSVMTIEPFVYLYITLMLLLIPFLKANCIETKGIYVTNIRMLNIFYRGVIVLNLVCILMYFPIMADISSGVDWGELKNTHSVTENKFWFYSNSTLSHLHLLGTSLVPIVLPLSFYLYFVSSQNIFNSLLFYSTITLELLVTIANANRGNIIIDICYLVCLYLMFRKHIKPKLKVILKRSIVLTFFCLLPFFVDITASRFGSDMAEFYNLKYAGENFVNFNGLLYHNLTGATWGDAYFTLITRIFDPTSIQFNTALEKWDFIDRTTGVRGQYFYTIIGAFLFEFGKTITLLLCLLFFIFASFYLRNIKRITVSKLIFYSTCVYTLINGVFFFKLQGSAGNITLLVSLFLMIFFSERVRRYKFILIGEK